jgi:hypothetical protein
MKWLRQKAKTTAATPTEKSFDMQSDSVFDGGNRDDSTVTPPGSPPKQESDAIHEELEMAAADPPAEKDLEKTASAVSADAIPTVYPKGFRLIVITASLCFSVFLVALDQTIIATAM